MNRRVRQALVSLFAAWFYLLAAIQPALHSCAPHHASHVPGSGPGAAAVSQPIEPGASEGHDGDHDCIACHLGLVSRALAPDRVRIVPPLLVLPVEDDRPTPHRDVRAGSHFPRGPPTA